METSGINAITHLLTTKLNDKKRRVRELNQTNTTFYTNCYDNYTNTVLSTDTHFLHIHFNAHKKSKLIKTEATSY